MSKWSVRKRDGVWLAFDKDGAPRYAAAEWWPVLTFACISSVEPRPLKHGIWSAYLPPFFFRHLFDDNDD